MGEKEYQNLDNEPAKIHFDFWLNDIDAETLYGCIRREISECHEDLVALHAKRLPIIYPGATEEDLQAYIDWYNGRINYLKELIKKLKHVRI